MIPAAVAPLPATSPAPEAVRPRRLDGALTLTATAKAAEVATLAALVTVVPRVLGPGDYGTLAIAMSVVAVGSLALSAGGPTLMSSYLPRVPAERRPALARSLGVRVARWRLLASAAIALLAVGLCVAAPDTFPAVVTLLVALALVLELAATLAFNIVLGLGRSRLWSFRYPVQNLVLIVAAAGFGALAGPEGAVAGVALAAAAALAVGGAAIAGPLRRAPGGSVRTQPWPASWPTSTSVARWWRWPCWAARRYRPASRAWPSA